jgi:hypothetical protein
MTRPGREVALLSWICIALFAARVIGQFEVLVAAPDWLPDMDAWYSGLLPYPLLLPVQVALLMIMAVVASNRRIRTGRFAAARPRLAAAFRAFALIYFVAMAIRLTVTLGIHGAEFPRHGAIPVAFHWVLALFICVSARASPLLQARTGSRLDGPDGSEDAVHGDVPALTHHAFVQDFSRAR